MTRRFSVSNRIEAALAIFAIDTYRATCFANPELNNLN
jgi:hypothetical protein